MLAFLMVALKSYMNYGRFVQNSAPWMAKWLGNSLGSCIVAYQLLSVV
jgi:hypothetical protein